MIKRAMYFFGRQDEEELSCALKERFPFLKFIDGQRWPTVEPPLVDGIHLCTDSYAYLWPSDLIPQLPTLLLSPASQLTGMLYQGPTAGPVISFQRCREQDAELQMGQLAVTIDDPHDALGRFYSQLVAFVKRRYACKMDCYSTRTEALLSENLGGYLAGKSIQRDPLRSPRLRLYFGRDDYLVCRTS